MAVFRCRRCHGDVAAPVREVPLPDTENAPAPYDLPKGEESPSRMRPGTFAYDPPEAGRRPGPRLPHMPRHPG